MATVVPTQRVGSPLAGLGDAARRITERRRESAALEALNEFAQARGYTSSGESLPGKTSAEGLSFLEELIGHTEAVSLQKDKDAAAASRLKDQMQAAMDRVLAQQKGQDARTDKRVQSTEDIAAAGRTSREGISAADRTSREEVSGADRTSREDIAEAERISKENTATSNRLSREYISKENRDSKEKVAELDREARAAISTLPSDKQQEINAFADTHPDLDSTSVQDLNLANVLVNNATRLDRIVTQGWTTALGDVFASLGGADNALNRNLVRQLTETYFIAGYKSGSFSGERPPTLEQAFGAAESDIRSGAVLPNDIAEPWMALNYLLTLGFSDGQAHAYLAYLKEKQEAATPHAAPEPNVGILKRIFGN